VTELSEAFHANETPEKLTAAICNKRACRGALGKARTRVLYGTKRVGTAGRLSTALTTARWANKHEQRLMCHRLIARGRVPLECTTQHAMHGIAGAGTEQVACVRREGRELLSWLDGLIDLELLVVTHCREYCCCSIRTAAQERFRNCRTRGRRARLSSPCALRTLAPTGFAAARHCMPRLLSLWATYVGRVSLISALRCVALTSQH
jgi:hypothetical protein